MRRGVVGRLGRMRSVGFAIALVVALVVVSRAETPYPAGSTSQTFDGMTVQIHVPAGDQRFDGGFSLIVVLHGAGGTETGMAGSLRDFVPRGFLIVAPKSKGDTWQATDLDRVHRLVEHVCEAYGISPERRHAVGFSNGGWNLHPIALDEKLRFRTATWIAAGFKGGSVPKTARREMGCLALAGEQDGNRAAAVGTIGALEKKVKWVDCRLEPNLGHAFPTTLVPYLGYFMEVFEGRFEPGHDLSYAWKDDLAAARETMATEKRGGFVYVWSKDADEKERELTRELQHDVFFDRTVRFFADQLIAVKLEKDAAAELIAEEKIRSVPAIVVFEPGGKRVDKILEGKLAAGKLAGALRGVAREKRPPK